MWTRDRERSAGLHSDRGPRRHDDHRGAGRHQLALYTNSVTRANEAVLKIDLFQMREALDQYYADKNKYPPHSNAGRGEIRPRDSAGSFTKSTDTWQTILSEPDPGNPSAEIGIFDVKSGSDRTAIDGTRYAEW